MTADAPPERDDFEERLRAAMRPVDLSPGGGRVSRNPTVAVVLAATVLLGVGGLAAAVGESRSMPTNR